MRGSSMTFMCLPRQKGQRLNIRQFELEVDYIWRDQLQAADSRGVARGPGNRRRRQLHTYHQMPIGFAWQANA